MHFFSHFHLYFTFDSVEIAVSIWLWVCDLSAGTESLWSLKHVSTFDRQPIQLIDQHKHLRKCQVIQM